MPTSRVSSADTHTWEGLAVFMTMSTRRQLLRRRVVALASLAAWFPIVTSAGGCISRTPARPASESAAAELLAQSAAGRRLLGLVRAVNAGDSSSILGFARAHYDSVALAESGGNARMLARWGVEVVSRGRAGGPHGGEPGGPAGDLCAKKKVC